MLYNVKLIASMYLCSQKRNHCMQIYFLLAGSRKSLQSIVAHRLITKKQDTKQNSEGFLWVQLIPCFKPPSLRLLDTASMIPPQVQDCHCLSSLASCAALVQDLKSRVTGPKPKKYLVVWSSLAGFAAAQSASLLKYKT